MKRFDPTGDREVHVTWTSEWVDNLALAAGAATTVNVPNLGTPEEGRIAVFSGTGTFWVDFNGGTAAVPAADVLETGSVFMPSARNCASIESFSIISDAACLVSIEWYS